MYDKEYYESFKPTPYVRCPVWLWRFARVADQIIRTLRPRRALDVGCAMGFLVEALRDRGVDAWGIDISHYAIQSVRSDIKPYCEEIPILDYPSGRSFDVVTCIELLEHIPADDLPHVTAKIASLTDAILFSSTPSGYAENTHVSVKSIEGWLDLFNNHGFHFDPVFDASFIASHAVLLRRQQQGTKTRVSSEGPQYALPEPPCQQSPVKRALFVCGCPGDTFRYRCEHQGEELGFLGWDVHYGSPGLMADSTFTDEYDLVVLQRLQHWAGLDAAIQRLRAKGKPVLFDADDLVFSEDAINDIQRFRTIAPQMRAGYLDGVRNMASTLRACTGAIVSTEALQLAVRRTAPHVPVWVNRNAVSNIMAAQATALLGARTRTKSELVRLGYFSGSSTHDADFSVCAEAVVHILAAYPQARLILAGLIQVPTLLLPLLDRLQLLPYVPWRELPGLLMQADINLAPLERQNVFTDCKSEVKYLEAGLLGIPTVASPVGGFAKAITNGQTGFLCESSPEWEAVLGNLIEQPAMRLSVGERARQTVLAEHVTWVRRKSLARILEEVFTNTQRPPTNAAEILSPS